MKTFEAINKNTGEIINLLKLKSDDESKIKVIEEYCNQHVLLCIYCSKPVTLRFLKNQLWSFICDSMKCNFFPSIDDREHEEFARKEQDYYNPEHYEDDSDDY